MLKVNCGILKLLVLLSLYGCQEIPIENVPSKYSTLKVELRDSTFFAEVSTDSIYGDNIIYDSCNVIEFDYFFVKDNQKYKFKRDGFREWTLSEMADTSKNFVNKIILHSFYPNLNYDNPPQTPIVYVYLNRENEVISSENTGVIENYKNIRIHIPRGGFFYHIFTFSWPSVKFPLKLNSSWQWKWKNDMASYSHRDFLQGDTIQEFIHEYKVTDEVVVDFEFGKVRCFEITAISTTKNDEIVAKYYFNSQLGFIKMEFVLSKSKSVVLYATDYFNKCAERFDRRLSIEQILM